MNKYTAEFLNSINPDKFYLCGFKTALGNDRNLLKKILMKSNPDLSEKDYERQVTFMIEYAKISPDSLFSCDILIICELDEGYFDLMTKEFIDLNRSTLMYSYPIGKFLLDGHLMITESFNKGYMVHMNEFFLSVFDKFGELVSEMFNEGTSVIGEIKAYEEGECFSFTLSDDEASEN